jgi:hypothetical protein
VDDECTFNVTVTDDTISGHVSCPNAQALDVGAKVAATSIELEFTATSAN